MSNTWTIIPRKGSRRFQEHITEEFYRNDGTGNEEKVESKPYESERWDGTRDEKIPIFDLQAGRFGIIDPEDPSRSKQLMENSEVLNKLVTRCRLRYESGHPKEGEFIEKADVYDPADPFFIHDDTMIVLDAGNAFINIDNPMNYIMGLVLLAQDDFALGGAKHNEHLNSKVRHIIVDTQIDRKAKKISRSNRKQVDTIIEELNVETALKLALALGIIQDVNFRDHDLLIDLLEDYANNTIDRVPGTQITLQKNFIDIYNLGNSLLDASYIFAKGVAEGVIKFFNNTYQAFGTTLGENRELAISFLTIPEQNYLVSRIRQAIDSLTGENTMSSGDLTGNMIDKSSSRGNTISIDEDDEDEDDEDVENNSGFKKK